MKSDDAKADESDYKRDSLREVFRDIASRREERRSTILDALKQFVTRDGAARDKVPKPPLDAPDTPTSPAKETTLSSKPAAHTQLHTTPATPAEKTTFRGILSRLVDGSLLFPALPKGVQAFFAARAGGQWSQLFANLMGQGNHAQLITLRAADIVAARFRGLSRDVPPGLAAKEGPSQQATVPTWIGDLELKSEGARSRSMAFVRIFLPGSSAQAEQAFQKMQPGQALSPTELALLGEELAALKWVPKEVEMPSGLAKEPGTAGEPMVARLKGGGELMQRMESAVLANRAYRDSREERLAREDSLRGELSSSRRFFFPIPLWFSQKATPDGDRPHWAVILSYTVAAVLAVLLLYVLGRIL